jgi:DNA-binding MarR family transcriptional regulator
MNIGILLRQPFQQLVEQIHNDLAEAGYPEIRPVQGVVFQFIGKNGARLTELAEKAQMTKQSMSYLVEYLEEAGHVERADDETDKRAKIFRLTKKGWRVVALAEQSIARFEDNCKKNLGAAKYKQLTALLKELNGIE